MCLSNCNCEMMKLANKCFLVKFTDKKINYQPGMHIQVDSASALPVDYDISPLMIVKFSNFKA